MSEQDNKFDAAIRWLADRRGTYQKRDDAIREVGLTADEYDHLMQNLSANAIKIVECDDGIFAADFEVLPEILNFVKAVSVSRKVPRMFNLLVSAGDTCWETDQLMRSGVERFKECTPKDGEAREIEVGNPDSLKVLEQVPTLLMYEDGPPSPVTDIVRYGRLHDLRVVGQEIVFRFIQEGQFTRAVINEFEDRLGIGRWELKRTHWAIKDGGLLSQMMARLSPTFDVVLSFAGEQRQYVSEVNEYLKSHGIRAFYDRDEEVDLWGRDLAEHLHFIYSRAGKYCVAFISIEWVEKMWTRHERRSAIERALRERNAYILPARFDDTAVPGFQTTISYIPLAGKTANEFGQIIARKLGKDVPGVS